MRHMRSKRHIIVFISLVLVTAAMLAYAFYFRSFVGIYIGDTSDAAILDQLDRKLTPELWDFIKMSFERVASVYLVFLVVTNVIWLIGTFYFLKCLRKDDHAA